jgi:hypothetical protein
VEYCSDSESSYASCSDGGEDDAADGVIDSATVDLVQGKVVLATVVISAAEAAASASAAAAAAVVAINEAIYCLIKGGSVYCLIKGGWLPGACRDIRSEDDRRIALSTGSYQVGLKGLEWISLVQEHAGDCGFSYEIVPAGFGFEGGSGGRGQVWSSAHRSRGVSEATALRALFKCDFSLRAACREFGGDQTLCWNVRKALKDFPAYEARDMEVAGAELEELVRVFVERVKCQVEPPWDTHTKKQNAKIVLYRHHEMLTKHRERNHKKLHGGNDPSESADLASADATIEDRSCAVIILCSN